MFSGITKELGRVVGSENNIVKTIKVKFISSVECKIGDSVSINGVCLTSTTINQDIVSFDIVPESLRKSTLKSLDVGDQVNIETAIKYGDNIGGHLVQGHVDEAGQIMSIESEGDAILVKINASKDFLNYLIPKGFVAIDGMSITIIDITDSFFTVTFIPHTIANTVVNLYKAGDFVNLEADSAGKYAAKSLRNVK